MTSRRIFVDTTVLPSDVFTYHDDDFYNLISQLAGPDETALFKLQGIRTVNSFLRTSNIFDIFNIDAEEINDIKKQICFILGSDGYIIKPGIKSSIEYLRDLFGKKQDEIAKNANSKHWNISNVSSTTITTPDSSLQTTNSTNTTVRRSTAMTTTTGAVDHRSLIIKSMDEWCIKHGSKIGIPDLKLIEGIDFVLILSSDDNGHVRCGCRASSRLSKQGKNFQLSNYYRHLKTGVCPMLEAKQQQNNNTNVNASNTASIQEETSTQQVTTIENTQMLAPDSSRSTRSKRPSVSPGTNQLKKKRRRN